MNRCCDRKCEYLASRGSSLADLIPGITIDVHHALIRTTVCQPCLLSPSFNAYRQVRVLPEEPFLSVAWNRWNQASELEPRLSSQPVPARQSPHPHRC
jgi:hypothetical protein